MTPDPKTKLAELLNSLGFEASIEDGEFEGNAMLNIVTDDSGRLIGRKGQTLAALQFVLNRILYKEDDHAQKITLDVGGYRTLARDELVKKAVAAADKVRRWGDVIELEPMNAFDRRIVHRALKDDPDVETHSIEVEASELKVIQLRPKSS
ncbi:MAG: KH domain-containing protein [Verrucomicrobiales bacterium]|nr:KH domain-containing protein [Verrucomicrobiales bacterium]